MTMDLLRRLAIYQAERFPLGRTSLLVAVFSSASVSASASLADRALPSFGTYLAAFVVTLCFFFQLRVLDEIKDADDDLKYRPERPIPRGLVSLRLIVGLGIATVPVSMVACAAVDPRMMLLLIPAWVWMCLMTVEFFAPAALKARPALYTVSHMLVMPLIDLVVTGFEWLPRGSSPTGLWVFLLMSFSNGCVLEIGRKLWSPQNEREGVETYSSLMGPVRAGALWAGCMCISLLLLVRVGFYTDAPVTTTLVGLCAAAWALTRVRAYTRDPSPAAQASMDATAGIWVIACYVAAGFSGVFGA
jgi:4-hydroxybenzoate polyprenyltransferase